MERKIIFAGPVGAGKTTAVAAISDIPVVSTEGAATDDVALRKARTTVAMDYGVLHLADGGKVHLYGAPGQDRFDFMWDILTVGGIGLVLMLDQMRPDPVADLDHYLDAFGGFIKRTDGAMVVGVSRMDLCADATVEPIRARLLQRGLNVPVFEVDARDREDIRQLLLALLSLLDPAVRRFR
ncbi:MAG: ATP/GTP-binding protein [Xanthomonadales bacterium]|nr:ATP/GTP-binding protein [Xanthomonadales bacterium]